MSKKEIKETIKNIPLQGATIKDWLFDKEISHIAQALIDAGYVKLSEVEINAIEVEMAIRDYAKTNLIHSNTEWQYDLAQAIVQARPFKREFLGE